MQGLNFIAIDFETAAESRASVCEAGICVVRDGKVTETRSWLVRPVGNRYCYWNTQVHGIRPADTANAPDFPEVWAEIASYLADCPVLVAHNAVFDMGCIRDSLELYGLEKPDVTYYCSLRSPARFTTSVATSWITFANASTSVAERTTARATMPRCAPACSSGKSGTRDGAT